MASQSIYTIQNIGRYSNNSKELDIDVVDVDDTLTSSQQSNQDSSKESNQENNDRKPADLYHEALKLDVDTLDSWESQSKIHKRLASDSQSSSSNSEPKAKVPKRIQTTEADNAFDDDFDGVLYSHDIGHLRRFTVQVRYNAVRFQIYEKTAQGTWRADTQKTVALSYTRYKNLVWNADLLKDQAMKAQTGKGEIEVHLGGKYFAKITKGNYNVSLRRHYLDSGKVKLSKWGVTFKIPEFLKLLKCIEDINLTINYDTIIPCHVNHNGQRSWLECLECHPFGNPQDNINAYF